MWRIQIMNSLKKSTEWDLKHFNIKDHSHLNRTEVKRNDTNQFKVG
jgi:hypothetical protein